VELAKVLMTRPRALLLDEPTTGLDPASRRNFLAALQRLQRERGMTVLMTSHVFSEAEDVDRVAIMREGKLLAYDTPAALRDLIGTEMVVVTAREPDALAERIRAELGLAIRVHGEELRLEETENGEGLPLLERILERFRPDISSISIKRPGLEDVFVHVTGKAVPEHCVEPNSVRRTGT
jgi:ABC-2 type transport system ATP-binding protein